METIIKNIKTIELQALLKLQRRFQTTLQKPFLNGTTECYIKKRLKLYNKRIDKLQTELRNT